MDKIIDKKRFNRIFRPFKNKMNELITKDKAEFSDSFSITNGENDLSFSPIDNGLELSTNNANNKMIISNDGKITINGVNIERNKKNIDYDERIKYKETTTKEYTSVIKPSNHSIYTSKNKSYTDTKAKFVPIDDDEYYTEYSGDNIVKNTYDIDSNGNTKIYYKKGARINNKLIDSDTEGIIDINILNYL